ncbi:hypothetical protein [Nocardia sp. BMG51109]|uniref:hypothetical protein n=1 Tax=Nocardia sp. BMG51109 TaxID=1056816 RepID=UPI000463BD8C|nr:hypothetical protein [Nocardia sp. BMG51109]
MPITDYMFADDPNRLRAIWIEARARRGGYRMDRKLAESGATGPDGYRLCDAETGHEVLRSAYLDDLERFLNG